MFFAKMTSQVRTMVGKQTGSRRMTLVRVMLGLALCVLIGGMTPAVAAWHGNDSSSPQRLYARQADGIWVSDDAEISWSQAGALPSRPLAMAVAERTSSPGTPGLVFVGTESLGLLNRAILQSIAHRAMLERGLLPDFSAAALAELDKIQGPAGVNGESAGD